MAKLIHTFQTVSELEQSIASIIIEEFKQPGLILLPVGKTFEARIYPLVNEYFGITEYQIKEELKKNQHLIHAELKVSHLDELIDDDKTRFSRTLEQALSNVIAQLQTNFFAINIDNLTEFDKFIKNNNGPRVIFLGLGSDPSNAHIAFIGEEFINTTTTIVALSDSVSKEFNCREGLTVGTDIFQYSNLEKIIVVVKGESKSQALEAALNDPDTGLGYLIKYHESKLKIYADSNAVKLLS